MDDCDYKDCDYEYTDVVITDDNTVRLMITIMNDNNTTYNDIQFCASNLGIFIKHTTICSENIPILMKTFILFSECNQPQFLPQIHTVMYECVQRYPFILVDIIKTRTIQRCMPYEFKYRLWKLISPTTVMSLAITPMNIVWFLCDVFRYARDHDITDDILILISELETLYGILHGDNPQRNIGLRGTIVDELAHHNLSQYMHEILLQRLRDDEREQDNRVIRDRDRRRPDAIYNDSQNVHNSNINGRVREVATNIIQWFSQYQLSLTNIRNCPDIRSAKLNVNQRLHVQYVFDMFQSVRFYINTDDTHSEYYTPSQLLQAVYAFIMQSCNAHEMLVRLLQELKDKYTYCATGCVAGVISSIQGFDIPEEFIIKFNDDDIEYGRIIHRITTYLKSHNLTLCNEIKTYLDTIDDIPNHLRSRVYNYFVQ